MAASRSDQSGSSGGSPKAARSASDIIGSSAPPVPTGLVDMSVRLSTRSGLWIAIHCAIAPPIERPTRCARSTPRWSRIASGSANRSSLLYPGLPSG